METNVIEIDGLRMRYGDRDVLSGVGFAARPGEVVALLGPNGAGKSTTIEILEGFRIRTGGSAAVLGTDPARGDERWRARVGIVLQAWRDHARWRVRELVGHQARYYPGRAWDPDVLIAAVGLTGQAGQRIGLLSGGQRRRLDLALGLIGRPEVLFLDEPTAGLDPHARREFHQLIQDVIAEYRTTVLLTTHDLDEAERLAARIVILDAGRVIADGTAAELARIAGPDEVRWRLHGEQHIETTSDATGFAYELFRRHATAVENLEIRRSSLEDTYLELVRRAEDKAARP
ncbi:ABC transporter ATP-binding protein [Dactylosporangium vinaceum]|uniref:ABC transporter ATP-binding protein n=1 Tax=Dactylosporangium vinaceum TaxID=53362 RepID=A0ABV5M584_9ACTN|nr:ABC transporter ATP-binding protein [Dactylosporangium vinaceum]UAB96057.1 ABC transporter ATP-binding protein [Dactylosporangium vinaceum]